MLKKLLSCSIILIISILFLNTSYATDISINSNVTDSDILNTDTPDIENTTSDYEDYATITTTDYDNGSDLSISNIINIVLISVGVVLILLGIAIIIKLK